MTTLLRTLLLFALPLALTAGDDGRLSAPQRAAMVEALESSQAALLAHVAGLSDQQWTFKPAPGRWSAAEIVEHLYRSEGFGQQLVSGLLATPANPEWRELTVDKTEMIRNVIPDRSQKAQAPESLQPTGQMPRGELVQALIDARAETIRMVAADTPYQAHVGMEGPLGPMNAAQWLEFQALHMLRHTKQLVEVLADPRFPQ